jgi:molecular chaperone DnaJ
LRLRGKGLPSVNRYGNGDLLIRVGVYIPEKLTGEEKEMMEKLAKSNRMQPTASASKDFFTRFRNMFE